MKKGEVQVLEGQPRSILLCFSVISEGSMHLWADKRLRPILGFSSAHCTCPHGYLFGLCLFLPGTSFFVGKLQVLCFT